ncbi:MULTISPECIES: hypothetical protein [unclassified Sulfitobacter]|jgi:hypothetical protein|nr:MULTISPECIES: hypothetical protein [unclassified Sulfitobacter]EAP78674.1 hypothetical protein NAS141_01551 [Sulfitobacter sp. NAS-14.1]|tara:strand:- start:6506 stop:6628 length:123 start_codon:yes stop_codon:yes gene_type:complete
MFFLFRQMFCFPPSRKPLVEVIRQSTHPFNHPTMLRKGAA